MRIFPYYIRGSFTFFSREEDPDINNNELAGVIKVATNTGEVATVCIIYEQNVIDGREIANSLVSGTYRNCFSARLLFKTWNAERTKINFFLNGILLFSIPVREGVPPNEAEELCCETSSVIYHLLTRGLLPDSYREDQSTESIDSIRFEQINSSRPRRSSGAQIAIENMVKVDDEILEDAFTCNMLIDRIKNCDTICSGDVKIKIIVREDNKEMMITNTFFDDNILVIDIDDVKEKKLDDNELLNTRMGDGLWTQINQAFNTYTLNMENIGYSGTITTASSDTSNGF